MQDPFAEIARFYDWEHASFQDDIPLYLGFARHAGGPVLELACGTGRLLVPLAKEGIEIVGIDASAAMLEIARARLDEAGLRPPRAEVHQLELTSFQLGRRFEMAFIALDSFGLLLERAAQAEALCRASDHLTDSGLFVIDVGNGNLRGSGATREFQVLTAPNPTTGRMLTKFAASETDLAQQLDTYTYLYDEIQESGLVQRTVTNLAVRYFGRFELELLLEQAGFVVESLYGSYDLEPYGSTSERLIAVARRAPAR